MFAPQWSPDGKEIAYSDLDIYVMNADGTGRRNITHSPRVDDYFPVWSPRGDRILFRANGQWHTIHPDGTHHLNLRRTKVFDPSWSLDGRRIAYHTFTTKHDFDIYSMTSVGTSVVNLTNTSRPVQEKDAAWSP